MIFDDVRRSLADIDFNMKGCAIGERGTMAGEGVVVSCEDGVYKVYDVDRNVCFAIEEYATENEASRAFLRRLSNAYGDWYDFSQLL